MTSICPCGSFIFPKNTTIVVDRTTAFDPSEGLPIPRSISKNFLHDNTDIFISNGQLFKTISEQITTKNIIRYQLNFPFPVTIKNKIKLTIKSYNLNRILTTAFFGSLGEITTYNNINIYGDYIIGNFRLFTNDLTNDRLIIEIQSICDEIEQTCCDKLPSSLTVSCLLNPCELCISDLYTTTPSP